MLYFNSDAASEEHVATFIDGDGVSRGDLAVVNVADVVGDSDGGGGGI